MDDQQLIEICNKIYNKHRRALDLIYEHRINNANLISDTVRKALTDIALTGDIIFDNSGKSSSFIIFYTPTMDRILAPLEKENSSYGTNRVYGYCISIRDTNIKAYFELGGWNATEEHRQMMDLIVERFKPKDKKKEEFKFKRIYRAKSVSIDDDNMEESIYAATEQFVRELLNMEKRLVEEIEKR